MTGPADAATAHPRTLKANTPAVSAAATASTTIGASPVAGTVSGITYTPNGTITGADTNTRTLTVVNKGADGNGTTVIGTLALVSGVNAADFTPKEITLSVVDDATDVVAGDVLAFVSTHASSGLADPGGLVEVTI